MTWTGQSFSVGQVLTAAQMNNLQADITALANADSGAPDIGPAIAAANSGAGVELGDISNGTSTSAGTVASENNVNIALTNWSLFPMIHVQAGGDGDVHVTGHATDGGSGAAPRLGLYNAHLSSGRTYDVDHRYIA